MWLLEEKVGNGGVWSRQLERGDIFGFRDFEVVKNLVALVDEQCEMCGVAGARIVSVKQ